MRISARNQLKGTVTAIEIGAVMAEVTVDIGNGNEVVAAITKHSVESLGLEVGSPVVAIIKSTEVIIGAD